MPGDIAVGDILATPVTGAYGHSMGSNYNKVLRPPVVFVRDGDARLVVRRRPSTISRGSTSDAGRMAYARVPLVSDLLEFLAGWDLSDGMIDTIDTVEVDRHLSVVAEQRLIGVLLAMRAGEVEVDRPEVVVEAHERALAHARLLDSAMLESVEILLDVGITSLPPEGAGDRPPAPRTGPTSLR